MVDREITLHVLTLLQECTALDRDAMSRLVDARVPCSHKMTTHETVQPDISAGPDHPQIGLLGILNGICGVFDDGPWKGCGPIAVIYDDDGCFKRFAATESAAFLVACAAGNGAIA